MKRSGLADSPFFTLNPEQEVRPSLPAPHSPVEHIRSLYGSPVQTHERTNEQTHERADAQTNVRTSERLNERANEQVNDRANERANERTDARTPERADERRIKRYSYDIFVDQAEAIDALCLKWKKERGKHVGKGETLRELLDTALKAHK
ncbi:MAG: hypothetical protein KJ065_28130 [Anaerolineae bacterium]|nr:hypothetical protein [Anaerolineae bacterium]